MAQVLSLYGITAVIFLVLDALGIRYLIRPIFEQHVGHLMAQPMRLAPAVAFYLTYVAGVIWMVSLPALREGQPVQALIGGLVLGFLCYATYEMTNFATLADWSLQQVVVDILWGTALTGFCAWVGVLILGSRLG